MEWWRVALATLTVSVAVALPVVAGYLSVRWIRSWRGLWRAAAAVPFVATGAWAITVVLGWPYDHNLFPFELVFLAGIAIPYLLLLRAVYWLAHRRSGGEQPD